MVYAYGCPNCKREFDVIKSLADFDRIEYCQCGAESERLFRPNSDIFRKQSGIPETASYNQALGKVIKDKRHLKETCKRMGVEPVGDEPVEKIHKKYDKERDEKREKAYDDATQGWVGDGS